MKKFITMAFALSFILCACSSVPAPISPTESPTEDISTETEVVVEGETEYEETSLYTADGYSIYIPDDKYEIIPSNINLTDKHSVTFWRAKENEAVTFSVSFTADETEIEAISRLEADGFAVTGDKEAGYTFMEIYALDITTKVRIYESPMGTYMLSYTYPLDAEEGFGSRLAKIMDTFELI